jgi:hypothetical protein
VTALPSLRSSPALSWVRTEDVALAGWSVALPAVAGWVGASGSDLANGTSPLVGLLQLLAVIGAFAALLTRPPDQPTVRLGSVDAPRWVICGPLVGGLAFASESAATNLGLGSGDWIIGLSFLAILVGTMVADHLPVVAAPLRRLFVVPFILISAAYFNAFAGTFLGSLDIGQLLASSPAAGTGFGLTLLVLLVGAMAAFYAMFVVAPRELADPEDHGLRWVLRFALFLASSLAGIGWLGAVGS